MDTEIKKRNFALLIIILIFAFLIRWDTIMTPRDFWIDESFQYKMAQKDLNFILDSPDVHPPLFNIFGKVLYDLGFQDPLILRFIMLFLSLVLIAVFFLYLKEFFNIEVAFYGSLILSFCWTYIYYATEFRSYTLVLIFTVIQLKYFNRLLYNKPGKSIFMLVLFTLLMVYSHYMAGLIIITQAIFLNIYWEKINIKIQAEYLHAFFYIIMSCIPLLIYLLRTIPQVGSFWFKDIDLNSLISTFGYILSPPVKNSILFLFFYILVFYGAYIFLWKHNFKYNQYVLYLFFPPLIMWIISQFFPFYHHRYFLFGGLSFFILLGYTLDKIDLKKKDLGLFLASLWMIVLVFTYPGFKESFNTELIDSAYNISGDVKDYDYFIHTSSFSYLPYEVMYPEKIHILLTNLTRRELFTAGGSVIDPIYIYHWDYDFLLENKSLIGVSDRPLFENIIYSEGGLYVTKRN